MTHINRFPGAEEEFPFGPQNAVFKIHGKMFAAVGETQDGKGRLNLTCEPELAKTLRASYEGVVPGYHMDKRHWDSVIFDGSVPPGALKQRVEHSHQKGMSCLPKKFRQKWQPIPAC